MKSSQPTKKSLPVTQAAKLFGGNDWTRNVKEHVISHLVQSGKLKGKSDKKQTVVVDDENFRHVMQYGIECFTSGHNGWCFTAVQAPIDKVAAHVRKQKYVENYFEKTKPQEFPRGLQFDATRKESREYTAQVAAALSSGSRPSRPNERHLFVVKTHASDWTAVLHCVHWFSMPDVRIALDLATTLSKALKTSALVAGDDDVSGSFAEIFKNGKAIQQLHDEELEQPEEFFFYFYEQEIYVPRCFLGDLENNDVLLVADPPEIERVDCARILLGSEG